METISRLVATFLLNAAWQIPLITAVAGLGLWLVRRAPARYRHGLWVAALGVSVVLPISSLRSPGLPGGAQRVPPGHFTAPRHNPSPGTAPFMTILPLPSRIASGNAPPARWHWFAWSDHLKPRNLPVPFSSDWKYPLAGCYLLSLLLGAARLGRAWKRTRGIQRAAYGREIPQAATTLIARCEAALGLEDVLVLVSPSGAELVDDRSPSPGAARDLGPLTLGVRRPVIILPETLFGATCAQDLTSALCHEMAHIRRRDFMMNLVCELAYLPIAFHPAAWLLRKRIVETRELACDEMAASSAVDAPTYARSLVSIARTLSGPAPFSQPSCTLGVFDANILEERIMRLLDKRPQLSARRAKLAWASSLLLLLLFAVTATAFSLTIEQNTPQTKTGLGSVSPNNTGTISGTVSDPSGARVPNAIVTLVDIGTGLKRTTAGDDAGEYSFAALPPGHYRVEANHLGFAVYRGKEYALAPGLAAPAQDIVLEPGSLLQAVEVTAKAPSPSLRSAGVRGGVVKGAPRRIRVGGLIQTTKLVSSKKPEYPEGPRAKGIQGVVLLEAVISLEGEPIDMKVDSSPDAELSKAAMDAVREWRYEPTLLNGQPIEVVSMIAVRFRLAP